MLQDIRFILYNFPEEEGKVQVIIRDETLWCTQKAMAQLFGVDRTVISKYIIRKSKFPQNPKRSVRFSGKRTKRSVQKRKARNTQKAETKVL